MSYLLTTHPFVRPSKLCGGGSVLFNSCTHCRNFNDHSGLSLDTNEKRFSQNQVLKDTN